MSNFVFCCSLRATKSTIHNHVGGVFFIQHTSKIWTQDRFPDTSYNTTTSFFCNLVSRAPKEWGCSYWILTPGQGNTSSDSKRMGTRYNFYLIYLLRLRNGLSWNRSLQTRTLLCEVFHRWRLCYETRPERITLLSQLWLKKVEKICYWALEMSLILRHRRPVS